MYSNKINGDRERLQAELTKLLKERISSLELIDSGDMLESTNAVVVFTNDGLNISIRSTDYFNFVDSKYDISNYVLSNQRIDSMIKKIYGDIAMYMILGD